MFAKSQEKKFATCAENQVRLEERSRDHARYTGQQALMLNTGARRHERRELFAGEGGLIVNVHPLLTAHL